MSLVIRELGPADENAFTSLYNSWEGDDPSWISFIYKPGMQHAEHLRLLQNNKDIQLVAPGRVPDSMFYAFLDDAIIVGRVSIRHCLNKHLEHRGGHIGYWVAPTYRKQGFAYQLAKFAIDFCQNELSIERTLITCAENNTPSIKIIKRLGGQLENTVWDDTDQENTCRYWIARSN